MINQTLQVVPHGLIESGSVITKFDETTGEIDASESTIVGVSIFSKTLSQSQVLKVDPNQLLSANIKPGMRFSFPNVAIVINPDGVTAAILYVNGDDNLNGTATLDLSGQYLSITHVLMNGTIDGETVQLELQQ